MNYVINKVRDLAVYVFMKIQCEYGQGSFDVEYAYRALLMYYGEVEQILNNLRCF